MVLFKFFSFFMLHYVVSRVAGSGSGGAAAAAAPTSSAVMHCDKCRTVVVRSVGIGQSGGMCGSGFVARDVSRRRRRRRDS